MSRESQEIFEQELYSWQPGNDPAPLRAAAAGHLGASRRLEVLLEEYAEAMENPENHAAAQQIADEMAPVAKAARIAAGFLPQAGG